jgi:hypothetical protein
MTRRTNHPHGHSLTRVRKKCATTFQLFERTVVGTKYLDRTDIEFIENNLGIFGS